MSVAGELRTRTLGATERSWCKAVPGGTGITVMALLLARPPDADCLQRSLRRLQINHPILNSKLRFDSPANSYSYVTSAAPYVEVRRFDLQLTSEILRNSFPGEYGSIPPFHLLLEHELNSNTWQNPDHSSDIDLFLSSLYTLEDNRWVATIRVHTSVCDRASALTLLQELLEMNGGGKGDSEMELGKEIEVNLPIEEYIPSGQGNKPFWARGVDVLGYSLNSFRLGNLSFQDTISGRMSRVVRLQIDGEGTGRILSSCQRNEIKLFELLAAAGLLATHSSKGIPEGQWEKYALVTLMDCRSVLDPPLCSNHIGFYHSAILNSHDIKGGEDLLELTKRVHSSFETAKSNKKHFTDMGDVNFLMCKAIENPGLTSMGSLRTSLISVFEDLVIDASNELHKGLGLEDFIGCSSVHGVGPSIAIFDAIRDGKLDCACVFPFPLHSREQMQELVDKMKRILLEGTTK
ncbi:uncharacterized protein LOC127239585 [Andrographis paniculata]|uniref:uncharacterized protein LOC127239585 n=1 Tax=Andrographis paniculata TaxID=175694 RepID=UPI0021E7ED50|nr:uncharacterized protein LOC127239585 [Andrographis paniculata]